MPKRSRGRARPPIARTSGQSASAIDKESLHGETNKTSDLALDTVEPGEAMSGKSGRQDFRRPKLPEGRTTRPDADGGLPPP